MATKQFKDLTVNEVFTFNGLEYKKIEEVRVSCCRSINACLVSDQNNKVQIKPLDEVTVNDEQK